MLCVTGGVHEDQRAAGGGLSCRDGDREHDLRRGAPRCQPTRGQPADPRLRARGDIPALRATRKPDYPDPRGRVAPIRGGARLRRPRPDLGARDGDPVAPGRLAADSCAPGTRDGRPAPLRRAIHARAPEPADSAPRHALSPGDRGGRRWPGRSWVCRRPT